MSSSREITSAFKIAFLALLGLTMVFAVLGVGLSIGIADPTKSQSSAESWLFGASSVTLSAMIGLFGGKVV